jgi:TetR/AcrR family transcriptional repressor of nem operon
LVGYLASMSHDEPTDTRSALLDAAEALVAARGFAGATVDAMVERAGVSKGAFFHHFSSKAELGRVLLERHGERERRRTERAFERADGVSDDPLVRVLIALALLEEELRSRAGEPAESGGSILASVATAAGGLDEETLRAAREALEDRRSLLAARLEHAVEEHAASREVDPEELAGMLEALLEGSRLLAGIEEESDGVLAAARRVGEFRSHLELLFGVPSRQGPHR